MGMFAVVRYDGDCAECGQKIKEWQTKDPEDLYLQMVEPREVRNFYGICDGCNAWNEYEVVPVGFEIRRVAPAPQVRPGRNMYGCTPCPKCKGEYRWPTQKGMVECCYCPHVEPYDKWLRKEHRLPAPQVKTGENDG